jgi:hypothetical protein
MDLEVEEEETVDQVVAEVVEEEELEQPSIQTLDHSNSTVFLHASDRQRRTDQSSGIQILTVDDSALHSRRQSRLGCASQDRQIRCRPHRQPSVARAMACDLLLLLHQAQLSKAVERAYGVQPPKLWGSKRDFVIFCNPRNTCIRSS